ncbi:hypothetical protein FCV25MIE_32743 [Fagus crenata]
MIRAFVQCLQKLLTFIAEVEQSRPSKALQLHMTTSLSLIKSIREWVAATRDVLSLFEGVVAPSTVPAEPAELLCVLLRPLPRPPCLLSPEPAASFEPAPSAEPTPSSEPASSAEADPAVEGERYVGWYTLTVAVVIILYLNEGTPSV